MANKQYKHYTKLELLAEVLQIEKLSTVEVELLLEEFFERLKPIVKKCISISCRRYQNQLTLTCQDIEDLIQQIFMSIFGNNFAALRNFEAKDENSLNYFLFDVAHHKVLDTLKYHKAERRPVISFSLDEPLTIYKETRLNNIPDLRKNPEELVLQKERMQQITMVLDQEKDKVTRQQDKEIMLAYAEGYSLNEIEAKPTIGLKRTGISSRIHALTSKLRSLIQ